MPSKTLNLYISHHALQFYGMTGKVLREYRVAFSGNKADPKFTRSGLLLLPLTTAFSQRGGDSEQILEKHGIPLNALSDPTQLVDAAACYAAIESMAVALGDPYFGANAGAATALNGSLAFRDSAALSKTFGDFLTRLIAEVASQVNNVHYTLTTRADTACLSIKRAIKVPGSTVQLDAIGVCFYVTLIERCLGPVFDPNRILITTATTEGIPPGFLPIRSLMRSEINGLQIVVPAEWLWAPVSFDWQVEHVQRGEFNGEDDRATIDYFRNVIAENMSRDELSLNRFSEIVGLHPRHVQRILSARDTSFSKIKDETRKHVAFDLLRNSGIPVAAVAAQLGFSSPPAFNRAFRQWTNKTPTQFRKSATYEGTP